MTLIPNPSYPPLPPPSEIEFSRARLPDAPPTFVIRLVLRLRRFLLELADKLLPPEIALFEHSVGVATTMVLGSVARHGIADALAAGPMTAAEIAVARGLNEDAVHRTMRMLSNMGIFCQRDGGRFENNRLSQALMSGRISRTREWILYFSSPSNMASWNDFSRTLETGKNAFLRVHGHDVWSWFDAHPDEREMFAHAMMGITTLDAPAIAAAYPFREVKRVCDVGGGRGTLLSELLLRHPQLTAVLYDNAGIMESAEALLKTRDVFDRVELASGSFFDKVPSGCDAYLLKNILHDWDDATCERILRNVRDAMSPSQRLVLCEMLVDRNSDSLLGSRTDLQMMIVCQEGRERGIDELEALFARTGFRLSRVFPSPTTSIIEALAVSN